MSRLKLYEIFRENFTENFETKEDRLKTNIQK